MEIRLQMKQQPRKNNCM